MKLNLQLYKAALRKLYSRCFNIRLLYNADFSYHFVFGKNVVAGETLYFFATMFAIAMLSPICDNRDSDLLLRVVITPYLVSLLSGMTKNRANLSWSKNIIKKLWVCDVRRKETGPLQTTSHAILSSTSYRPPVVIALLSLVECYLATCDLMSFSNESSLPSVIGYTSSMSHTSLPGLYYCPRAMLSSTWLCYRLQGYVIVHRAMLWSNGLCYRPLI